jgi:hypothetical protein
MWKSREMRTRTVLENEKVMLFYLWLPVCSEERTHGGFCNALQFYYSLLQLKK